MLPLLVTAALLGHVERHQHRDGMPVAIGTATIVEADEDLAAVGLDLLPQPLGNALGFPFGLLGAVTEVLTVGFPAERRIGGPVAHFNAGEEVFLAPEQGDVAHAETAV